MEPSGFPSGRLLGRQANRPREDCIINGTGDPVHDQGSLDNGAEVGGWTFSRDRRSWQRKALQDLSGPTWRHGSNLAHRRFPFLCRMLCKSGTPPTPAGYPHSHAFRTMPSWPHGHLSAHGWSWHATTRVPPEGESPEAASVRTLQMRSALCMGRAGELRGARAQGGEQAEQVALAHAEGVGDLAPRVPLLDHVEHAARLRVLASQSPTPVVRRGDGIRARPRRDEGTSGKGIEGLAIPVAEVLAVQAAAVGVVQTAPGHAGEEGNHLPEGGKGEAPQVLDENAAGGLQSVLRIADGLEARADAAAQGGQQGTPEGVEPDAAHLGVVRPEALQQVGKAVVLHALGPPGGETGEERRRRNSSATPWPG